MTSRRQVSLVGTLAVVILISIPFVIAGVEPLQVLACVAPALAVVMFPIVYLISSALPRFSQQQEVPVDSDKVEDIVDELRPQVVEQVQGEPRARKGVWWVTLVVGGIAFLVFAVADWITESQVSIISISAGLALLLGGITQRASLNRDRST